GDDPQTTDDEEGFLDYDQRHLLRFQAVTRLPHEIAVGTAIQWSAGTPYSVISTVIDQDSTGNQNFRTFFPTRQRNDQRNLSAWQIDGRIEKGLVMGKVRGAAYLIAENLLDADTLTIHSYNLAAFNGVPLDPERDPGRRFELGLMFDF
ncbi:MAG TPA: hypothetical protein VFG76_10115, partial [Candidatus Polarisedimenticolia bacterium]|nr:hypothetical protein [Candidatus Polarisedimenticolia bacterium]